MNINIEFFKIELRFFTRGPGPLFSYLTIQGISENQQLIIENFKHSF